MALSDDAHCFLEWADGEVEVCIGEKKGIFFFLFKSSGGLVTTHAEAKEQLSEAAEMIPIKAQMTHLH